MKKSALNLIVWILSAAILTIALSTAALAKDDMDDGKIYKVMVTNLTHAQTFTPIVAATHLAEMDVFKPGETASLPLEVLAEGGNTMPLVEMLEASPRVLMVKTTGPVPPGHTMTFMIRGGKKFTRLSLVAMLVPTNDAFVGLNSAMLRHNKKFTMTPAYAFDAGTEINDEFCDNIPGGGVCEGENGEGFNEMREEEGSIRIHRGIHGIGDLDEEVYDWRNPVAMVMIQKIQDEEDDNSDD